MAIASSILAAIAFVSIAVIALLLIRFYLPLRTTPYYLLFPVYLALVIPCSIIVLVPIDLASNSGSEADRGVTLKYRVLLVAWRIAYWLSFALTWAILPILQSYSDSGHRSPEKRFFEALRMNARYQLMVLSLGTVGLIYFIYSNGFDYLTVKSLIIALSYCYALTYAVYLMGHGLVAIPRELYRDASVSGKLRRLQTKAVKVHDALVEATDRLEEIEKEVWAVSKRGRGSAREFQEWIEELVDSLQLPESALAGMSAASNRRERSRSPIPQVITEQYLAGLTKRLRAAVHKKARYQAAWISLVRNAANTQAILDSSASKRLIFRPNPHSIAPIFEKLPMITPYTRHIVHYHILPPMRIALATCLGLASACVVWSEIINVNESVSDKLSIISLSIVHHPSSDRGTVGFAGQVIASAWLAYMCAAAYDSLTSVKVWGGYALVRRQTSGSSACFYASYACRLTVPLAYNFSNFLPSKTSDPSVFNHFFGVSVNLTPVGAGFNSFFPILILLPVCATLFNLYGKVKDFLGFGAGVLEDEDEDAQYSISSGWREGRDLIDRELGGDHTPVNGSIRDNDATAGLVGAQSSTPLANQRTLSPRPYQPSANRARQARLDTGITPREGEEEEEGAFGAFFHRVRNTLDLPVDGKPPKWMQDAGVVFKKPKWMDNGEGGSGGGGSSNTGGASNNKRPKWMQGNFFGDDDESS